MRKVGAFEGKTHFSALIEAAEHGETILVTRKGRPVAQIAPVPQRSALMPREAAARMLARKIRAGASPRELIDEGRKH